LKFSAEIFSIFSSLFYQHSAPLV